MNLQQTFLTAEQIMPSSSVTVTTPCMLTVSVGLSLVTLLRPLLDTAKEDEFCQCSLHVVDSYFLFLMDLLELGHCDHESVSGEQLVRLPAFI